MVERCMPNSGHGGPPGTGVMTIFVFYVSAQICNFEYFEKCGGLQAPGGISSFFSSNFTSNVVIIMSGDKFLTRVMTIFVKTYIFVKVREGRKGGREEGRKGGREEGRKGGREEGLIDRNANRAVWGP